MRCSDIKIGSLASFRSLLALRMVFRTCLLANLTITGRYLSLVPAFRRWAMEMSWGCTVTPSAELQNEMIVDSTDLLVSRNEGADGSSRLGALEAISAADLSGSPRKIRLSLRE